MNSFTKQLNNDYLSSKSVTYISVDIQPTSDHYVKEALEIAGLSMQELEIKGTPPKEATKKFAD
jgi:hypothetical protein